MFSYGLNQPKDLYGIRLVRGLVPRLRITLLREFCQPPGLVGSSGLEPPTSRLSGARSNRLSYEPIPFGALTLNGGDERDRTADPLLARQVLSQLSYTPSFPF